MCGKYRVCLDEKYATILGIVQENTVKNDAYTLGKTHI